jgi:hypothetical protein
VEPSEGSCESRQCSESTSKDSNSSTPYRTSSNKEFNKELCLQAIAEFRGSTVGPRSGWDLNNLQPVSHDNRDIREKLGAESLHHSFHSSVDLPWYG